MSIILWLSPLTNLRDVQWPETIYRTKEMNAGTPGHPSVIYCHTSPPKRASSLSLWLLRSDSAWLLPGCNQASSLNEVSCSVIDLPLSWGLSSPEFCYLFGRRHLLSCSTDPSSVPLVREKFSLPVSPDSSLFHVPISLFCIVCKTFKLFELVLEKHKFRVSYVCSFFPQDLPAISQGKQPLAIGRRKKSKVRKLAMRKG